MHVCPVCQPSSALYSAVLVVGARKTGQIMNEHLVVRLNIQLDMPIVFPTTGYTPSGSPADPPQVVNIMRACPGKPRECRRTAFKIRHYDNI